QTPTGFLVDRVSARMVIICGLILGAGAFAVAGLVNSFWVFVAMFAVAGIANTVYHPADYAILSQHIPPARAGRVFSFHTFSGMLGNAVAPPTLLFMSAAGVLAGGILTGMTSRHGLVASGGLVVTAIVCVLIGLIDFNALALVVLMSAAGFFSGLTMPSRDMIVRAVTPPGAY